ncbi:MAG: glycerol-3-phosphate dehydrogenase/oxidase [Candidatus Eisenbacteria bacterium]|nr:glycerol-3-phosphate dehydrogenase/oxidase [Candidatus Eisenbacteria bacterium]
MTDPARDLQPLEDRKPWDLLVIGGGANGLGVALDAVSRGYRTLMLERGDFACGTSSRSTKLVHGGVRYLEQGRIGLVRESLRERATLLANAPGLVHPIRFVVPAHSRWERAKLRLGLRLYDRLAPMHSRDALGRQVTLPPSRTLTAADAVAVWPGLAAAELSGAVTFSDAQFDDARLAVALARRIRSLGGVTLNYAEVVAVDGDKTGRIVGVQVVDRDPARAARRVRFHAVRASVVVDATGAFTEFARRRVALSRGSHVVLGPEFVRSDHALLIPRTEDGRVLFAIPWYGRLLVGTTDLTSDVAEREPRMSEAELSYLLAHIAPYLHREPKRTDVESAWTGLRALLAGDGGPTSRLSREHGVLETRAGLLSVVGGKWTTYRATAEDVVSRAAEAGGLPPAPSRTASIQLDGDDVSADSTSRDWIRRMVREDSARCVADVLARRSRLLFLDARAAESRSREVAEVLAGELGLTSAWVDEQVREFGRLAAGYLPPGITGTDDAS